MNAPIGVFDSGIGGLSVLQALRKEMPQQDFIYLADSAHAPYGERDDGHVAARSQCLAGWLAAQDVAALVVACNTATAAAIHLLRERHPALAIVGVEPAIKPAAALSKTGRIGVLATRGTLNSRRFQALLASQAGRATFVVQACDGLADAIERSAVTGVAAQTLATCARYTGAMGTFGQKDGDIDTLVLGCTHYPLAQTHLRALLGPDVQLVDSGDAVARQTRRQLPPSGRSAGAGVTAAEGKVHFFSTGEPGNLQAAAGRWLGLGEPVELLHL